MLIRRLFSVFLLALVSGVSAAQEEAPADSGFLETPMVEPSPVTGEAIEPEITIRESGDQVIYEYRVRGVLYMVRVLPQVGPPYYLYDLNGDGQIDPHERSPHNTAVPQWVLFEWN